MDSISSKIEIKFSNLHTDGSDLTELWQILLRIVGDFSIIVNGQVFYSEEEFCVVEFAYAAAGWLAAVGNPTDFDYTSMEAEEAPFIWIHQMNEKWQPGAIYQQFEVGPVLSAQDVREALTSYNAQLVKAVKEEFGIDILPRLGG